VFSDWQDDAAKAAVLTRPSSDFSDACVVTPTAVFIRFKRVLHAHAAFVAYYKSYKPMAVCSLTECLDSAYDADASLSHVWLRGQQLAPAPAPAPLSRKRKDPPPLPPFDIEAELRAASFSSLLDSDWAWLDDWMQSR
jgi:hypothetical protein